MKCHNLGFLVLGSSLTHKKFFSLTFSGHGTSVIRTCTAFSYLQSHNFFQCTHMNQLLQHLLQNVHQQKRDHPCEGERMPHWKINISFVLSSQWTNPFHDGITETVTSN